MISKLCSKISLQLDEISLQLDDIGPYLFYNHYTCSVYNVYKSTDRLPAFRYTIRNQFKPFLINDQGSNSHSITKLVQEQKFQKYMEFKK